jgi:hypothetical protein
MICVDRGDGKIFRRYALKAPRLFYNWFLGVFKLN